VAAHLQWHLERQLRTLPLVERAYRVDRTVDSLRSRVAPLLPAEPPSGPFGQDEAHGYDKGQGQEGDVPAVASGA
jgi:DNA repair protein RecO (recombination protein O)